MGEYSLRTSCPSPIFEGCGIELIMPLCGQEHPDVAASKVNISLVFKAMGKKSSAKQMFTEAAGIHRKVLGADHLLTKTSERLAVQ
jgi:hypothetical protein